MPTQFKFNIFFVTLISIFFLQCSKEEVEVVVKDDNNSEEIPKPITWLALGDSYTIGQGVKEQERFPAQAVALLNERNIRIDSLKYIAVTGWTTYDLWTGLNFYKPNPHTIVSLLIGVNDQYINRDTTDYRKNFSELLIRSIALANDKPNRVFVISIPDYSVTPFARNLNKDNISKQIDQFNSINGEVALKYGCQYIDITPFTREAKNNPLLICEDNLHPSALDYARWAEKLVSSILLVIR